MNNKNTTLSFIFLTMIIFASINVKADGVSKEIRKTIQDRVSTIVRNASNIDIKPTPVKNLYQVTMGTTIIYITADAKYLLNGVLIDLESKNNLTNRARKIVIKEAVKKIPKSSTIIYMAKGKTKHIITVFSDIDCPYCHKLHKEIPKLNAKGVEVRYVAFPRAGIGSSSYYKAVSVWCAKNRAKAMDDAMQGKVIAKKCNNSPVIKHLKLAQDFNVSGTPTIITQTGIIIPGYLPADKLIQTIESK